MWSTVQNFLLMSGTLLPRKKVYTAILNDYQYICDAAHWTTLTTAGRKVIKAHLDTNGDIDETRETSWYDNLATDLATVEALSFS